MDLVQIDGESWVGWNLTSPLDRETTDVEVTATRQPCDDGGGGQSGSAEPEDVTLAGIEGLSVDQVLADREHPSQVYVKGDAHLTLDSMPPAVREFIKQG